MPKQLFSSVGNQWVCSGFGSRSIRSIVTLSVVLWSSLSQAGIHAQGNESFCGAIERLAAEAQTQFHNIRKPGTRSDVTLNLPNAKECYVVKDEYSCTWAVDTPNQGLGQFKTFATGLTGCFRDRTIEWHRDEGGLYIATMPGYAEVVLSWDRERLEIFLSVVRNP